MSELYYASTILLSNSKRKTCESLGREMGISGDTVSTLLDKEVLHVGNYSRIVRRMFKNKKPYLVLDDTFLDKKYSKKIQGTSDHYIPSEGVNKRSVCVIAAALTDGKVTAPVHHAIWTSREFDPENYATKSRVAQKVIGEVKEKIDFSHVVMDGLYATQDTIKWCNEQEIPFEMRMHSNRVIRTEEGQKYRISDHPGLELKGMRTERMVNITWHEIKLCVTVVGRRNKRGDCVNVYQVSNYKAPPKIHKKIYGYRWNIEKFFRTAKQHLGFKDCQSRKLERHKAHIQHVFLAYIVAQQVRLELKMKNVEDAIHYIKKRSSCQKPAYVNRCIKKIIAHA